MTIEDVEAYLRQYIVTDKRINDCRAKIESYISSLMTSGIRYDSERVDSSAPSDPMAEVFGKVDELEQEIKVLTHLKEEQLSDAHRLVDMLENAEERIVIRKYYLSGNLRKNDRTMEKLAEQLAYDRTTIYRIKDRGLENLRHMRQIDEL